MKIYITLFILVSTVITAFGQADYGLKVSGGLSKISYSNSTNLFRPSGNAGLFYNFKSTDKYSWGIELMYMYVNAREKIEMEFRDNYGNNTGHAKGYIDKNISYLSLPIYYGIKTDKLIIKLGLQASYKLSSSIKSKTEGINNGEPTSWNSPKRKLNIKKYDFGPKAGVILELTDKISLEGEYYYGLSNINKDLKWKVQQLSVGVRYSIAKIHKDKDATNDL